jgi:hypothetical protein
MAERVQLSVKKPEAKRENKASQTQKKGTSQSISSPVEQILFLQRTIGNQAVGKLIKSRALQAKLRIGQPGDIYEQEADRVAEQVMRMPGVSEAKDTRVQRKCPKCLMGLRRLLGMDKKCEKLQAKETPGNATEATPKIETNISTLRGGGQPLPESVRAFFEPRFGHDFGRVRIHTDKKAAKSAQLVHASAYTVGQDIVFGSGRYAPETPAGRKLLAHELAHTTQQHPGLARQVCLDPSVCQTVLPPSQLLIQAETSALRAQKEQRKTDCGTVPPAPACQADGHGLRATEVETLLNRYDPRRMQNVKGIFVNMDIEPRFKALTVSCADFTPPLDTSGECITVPKKMEEDAKTFNTTTGPLIIDGKERGLWRERTLEILVHEAQHVDFRATYGAGFWAKISSKVTNIMGKARPTCKKDEASRKDIFSSANELTAMIQEFPMRFEYARTTVRLTTPEERDAELEEKRTHRIRGTRQSITNSMRIIRCMCGCSDANAIIKEAIEFGTKTWTQGEKDDLNREMNRPEWNSLNLNWPFPAPGESVNKLRK